MKPHLEGIDKALKKNMPLKASYDFHRYAVLFKGLAESGTDSILRDEPFHFRDKRSLNSRRTALAAEETVPYAMGNFM